MEMKKISLVISGLILHLLQFVFAHHACAELARPNIIFLLTDDHRADLLGCYGNPMIETPNLDRLARDGVLFENSFVTSAICTPSRASIFLGQYERRHGINFNSGTSMDPEAWKHSYPVALRKAGYYTGYVGKNHVPIGPQGYESGIIEESFDFWYAAHGHLWFYPKESHEIFQHAISDTQVEIIEEGALSFLQEEKPYISGAKMFLERRPTGRPFCLTVALNLPHGAGTKTMQMRPSDGELYVSHYRDCIASIPLPQTYLRQEAIRKPKIPSNVFYPEFRQLGYNYVSVPKALRERIVRQYQTITGIDRFVGNLRNQLAELDIEDNTILVFTSDHGIMLGEFGLGGKALNYEPCLRVPMIILDPRLPAARKGQRIQELAMSIDIAPTIMEWASVSIPDSGQGRSMVPILEDVGASWRNITFAENLWSTIFGNPRCESVRTSRWKYIRYFANDRSLFAEVATEDAYKVNERQKEAYEHWLTSSIVGEQPDYEELFDLENDPGEIINLVDDLNYTSVLTEMRDHCRQMVSDAKGDVDAKPLTLPLPLGVDTK